MAISEKQKSKPGKTRPAQHPPGHGTREEKRQRDKHDEKFNYGGRDQTPDEDVNPPESAAGTGRIAETIEAAPAQEEPFASRLPGRAFRRGDLFTEE